MTCMLLICYIMAVYTLLGLSPRNVYPLCVCVCVCAAIICYVYYHIYTCVVTCSERIYCVFILGDITISGGISFTLDSDLNGASLQFTLTCISTGGPATTVTWTRDSVTITEGNETVLDNRKTSQYTHTLTVTGRLGGLYTCTVANNKPSQDSATYTVQGTSDTVLQLYVYLFQCLRDCCLLL